MQTKDRNYQQVRQATLLTGATHILLGLAKVFFGIVGHSQALVADGIHSFADLFTDVLVIIAARIGAQAADEDHPYGHARIETAVAVALSLVLFVVGITIFFQAIHQLRLANTTAVPTIFVILVAIISVVANECLFRYLVSVAKRCQSQLLRTNAWHCRSDAASSLVVLVGVIAAHFGFHQFDAIAAMLVSLLIIKMAWDLGWPCIRELVDTGIDAERLAAIKTFISATSGVVALHQLRTRLMAGDIYIDVHVIVSPCLSVSEGHYIGELVHDRLLAHIPEVKDVTVHVDPEDDEEVETSQHLPTRDTLLELLKEAWQTYPLYDDIKYIQLHYLSGAIHIELHFIVACVSIEMHTDILSQYKQIVEQLDYIKKVEMHLIIT